MSRVRLGAVGYLNARPCVMGLDHDSRFDLRFDLPARCAALLHEGLIDVGLVPSIEYLRGGGAENQYRVVPGVSISSDGPVASVALYTKRPMTEVRTIALDTSSRTSVALTRVLCARAWNIDPTFEPIRPELPAMLAQCDAALLIGDLALFVDHRSIRLTSEKATSAPEIPGTHEATACVEKIDLGEMWLKTTGLPFVYAFWAGRFDALQPEHVAAIQAARDAGVAHSERVAAEYLAEPALRLIGAQYLRDNIKYQLGERERAGLETFYRYAAELGLVQRADPVRFFDDH